MEQTARTSTQIGASLRRQRKKLQWSQEALGDRVKLRQATISSLESGDPGTKLGTLLDVLSALELELVIRPRTQGQLTDIEDLL